MTDKRIVLQHLHDAIDKANGDFGYGERFCLLCRSKNYDASGIVHEDNCPIIEARKALSDTPQSASPNTRGENR